jgi:hypothetical protein
MPTAKELLGMSVIGSWRFMYMNRFAYPYCRMLRRCDADSLKACFFLPDMII